MKTVHSAMCSWAYPPASPERAQARDGGQEASKIRPLRSLGGIPLRYHLSETGIASEQKNMKRQHVITDCRKPNSERLMENVQMQGFLNPEE
jgi:hypothetical protein